MHPRHLAFPLLGLVILLAGCAQLAAIAPGGDRRSASTELTVLMTGYARGYVDPTEDCG